MPEPGHRGERNTRSASARGRVARAAPPSWHGARVRAHPRAPRYRSHRGRRLPGLRRRASVRLAAAPPQRRGGDCALSSASCARSRSSRSSAAFDLEICAERFGVCARGRGGGLARRRRPRAATRTSSRRCTPGRSTGPWRGLPPGPRPTGAASLANRALPPRLRRRGAALRARAGSARRLQPRRCLRRRRAAPRAVRGRVQRSRSASCRPSARARAALRAVRPRARSSSSAESSSSARAAESSALGRAPSPISAWTRWLRPWPSSAACWAIASSSALREPLQVGAAHRHHDRLACRLLGGFARRATTRGRSRPTRPCDRSRRYCRAARARAGRCSRPSRRPPR